MKAALCAAVIFVCAVLALPQKASELNGKVTYRNRSPATGVVLTIGNYSVTTDKDGYYRMTFLPPGTRVILISPPKKRSRSVRVKIGAKPTKQDFVVDW
jgi:hypothetical protein